MRWCRRTIRPVSVHKGHTRRTDYKSARKHASSPASLHRGDPVVIVDCSTSSLLQAHARSGSSSQRASAVYVTSPVGVARYLNRAQGGFDRQLSNFNDVYRCKYVEIVKRARKGKEEYLYSAFYILYISQSAHARITQFYLQIHHACLSFVSVHQMAPPLTEVRDSQLQLTTHQSTPKGWKAELAWLVDQ